VKKKSKAGAGKKDRVNLWSKREALGGYRWRLPERKKIFFLRMADNLPQKREGQRRIWNSRQMGGYVELGSIKGEEVEKEKA